MISICECSKRCKQRKTKSLLIENEGEFSIKLIFFMHCVVCYRFITLRFIMLSWDTKQVNNVERIPSRFFRSSLKKSKLKYPRLIDD
jgi:hypothetical protein